MTDYLEFEGREIDEVNFTGLMESLSIIKIVAALAKEDVENLTKDELIAMIEQMSGEASKAFLFSGATDEEAKQMTDHMLKNLVKN